MGAAGDTASVQGLERPRAGGAGQSGRLPCPGRGRTKGRRVTTKWRHGAHQDPDQNHASEVGGSGALCAAGTVTSAWAPPQGAESQLPWGPRRGALFLLSLSREGGRGYQGLGHRRLDGHIPVCRRLCHRGIVGGRPGSGRWSCSSRGHFRSRGTLPVAAMMGGSWAPYPLYGPGAWLRFTCLQGQSDRGTEVHAPGHWARPGTPPGRPRGWQGPEPVGQQAAGLEAAAPGPSSAPWDASVSARPTSSASDALSLGPRPCHPSSPAWLSPAAEPPSRASVSPVLPGEGSSGVSHCPAQHTALVDSGGDRHCTSPAGRGSLGASADSSDLSKEVAPRESQWQGWTPGTLPSQCFWDPGDPPQTVSASGTLHSQSVLLGPRGLPPDRRCFRDPRASQGRRPTPVTVHSDGREAGRVGSTAGLQVSRPLPRGQRAAQSVL